MSFYFSPNFAKISPTLPVLSKYYNSLDSGKDLDQNANLRDRRSIVILLSFYSDANLILDTQRPRHIKKFTSGILTVISVAPSCTKSYISWDFTTNINDMTGIIASVSIHEENIQPGIEISVPELCWEPEVLYA